MIWDWVLGSPLGQIWLILWTIMAIDMFANPLNEPKLDTEDQTSGDSTQ